jgi:arginine deiminase
VVLFAAPLAVEQAQAEPDVLAASLRSRGVDGVDVIPMSGNVLADGGTRCLTCSIRRDPLNE